MGKGPAAGRDRNRRDLTRGTAGLLVLRVLATGCGFLSGVVLARLLGPAEFGTLVYAGAWGSVLANLSTLGFNQLLVREIAIHRSEGAWALIKGIMRFCSHTAFAASVLMASIALLIAMLLADRPDMPSLMPTLTIVLVGLPFVALAQLRQSAMRGFDRPVIAMAPELGVLPVLSLLLIAIVYLAAGPRLLAPHAAAIGLVGTVVVYVIGHSMLVATTPDSVRQSRPAFANQEWLAKAMPLYLIGIVQFANIQADLIMLGLLGPADDVAFFAVAKSLAETVIFVLVAAELYAAPQFAQMYTNREFDSLQNLVTRTTRMALGAAVPLALVLVMAGAWILPIYGPSFVAAVPALTVLCCGQLINAACGPIGQLAIHTGHDKATVLFVFAAVVVNISLNALLIPQMGAVGAAIATAASVIVWNISLTVFIFRRTGLLSFIIGRGRAAGPALAETRAN